MIGHKIKWPFMVIFVILNSIILVHTINNCGYQSCNQVKEGFLNVHLVPHSHDDVGWLKTVKEYYNGEQNEIQDVEIRKIFQTVLTQLAKDKTRKFIIVESAYLWRWWMEQREGGNKNFLSMRKIMSQLVRSGQLEFVSGGWTMNDEACTHYTGIIDQMSLGLRFLNDTFGTCGVPKIGWQIDPFGHSQEYAALSAALGFEGLFIGRLHFEDKGKRLEDKNMEFIWSANHHNLGKEASIFTSILFNLYQPPRGFCFDPLCQPRDTIQDDPRLDDYNLKEKMEDFIQKSFDWAAPYKTKNILMTMGSDFCYQDATSWYTNMDKLIGHINARQSNNGSKINLLYSTPSCYLKSVHDARSTWEIKTDDFFPYAENAREFWTGYFSSRPTFKFYARQANHFLQICKQLAAMTDTVNRKEQLAAIFALEEPLAVTQHHDAISGTAKQHVTDDYALQLSIGMAGCEPIVGGGMRAIESDTSSIGHDAYTFCHQLNFSVCGFSEKKSIFMVTVYNPLAWEIQNNYVRIPISTNTATVEGVSGQIVPIPDSVMKIPGRVSTATHELVFPLGSLAGFSLTSFKIRIGAIKFEKVAAKKPSKEKSQSGSFLIQNSVGLTLKFSEDSGLLQSIQLGESTVDLSQNFYYYKSSRSGAYIFRPDENDPTPVAHTVNYTVIKGDHVTEVHQIFSDWVSQVIRLYDRAESVEFEWLVGPIPIAPGQNYGKEVITRFESGLKTHGIFYTDANGRQLIQRELKEGTMEPVASNYYPVTSTMIISEGANLQENGRTLILLNDRAQGGSSLNDGEMELMLDRRLLYDDYKGVGEPLNERAFGEGLVARGKIQLIFSGENTGIHTSIHRRKAKEIFMEKMLAFRDEPNFEENFSKNFGGDTTKFFSALPKLLPANCHVLSLSRMRNYKFLIRLEHFYEKNDLPIEMSKEIVISLKDLKTALGANSIRETTLGLNQWMDETGERFEWKTFDRNPPWSSASYPPIQANSSMIVLKPMQIRSFIFTLP